MNATFVGDARRHLLLSKDDFIFLQISNSLSFHSFLDKVPREHVIAYSGDPIEPRFIQEQKSYFAILAVSALVEWVTQNGRSAASEGWNADQTATSIRGFIVECMDLRAMKDVVSRFVNLCAPDLLMGIAPRKNSNIEDAANKLVERGLAQSLGGLLDRGKIVELARRYL